MLGTASPHEIFDVRERKMKTFRITIVLMLPLLLFGIGASPRSKESRISALRATQASLKVALDMYQVDTGAYPTEQQGLQALITNPGVEGWYGPYLRVKDDLPPPDPWGNQFRYTLVDGKPRVDSAGADATFGTEDDNKTRRARTTGCSRTRYPPDAAAPTSRRPPPNRSHPA